MKKYNSILNFKIPEGTFCAATCISCAYYNLSDTNSSGWGWCTRLGGYRSPRDYCGYHPQN